MVHYFTSTAAFMTAVAGEWSSPVTGTRFYFAPATTAIASGTIVIHPKQKGLRATFTFTAQFRNGDIVLVTEDNRYPVWIIGQQVHSLAIALSPGELLQLVKRK